MINWKLIASDSKSPKQPSELRKEESTYEQDIPKWNHQVFEDYDEEILDRRRKRVPRLEVELVTKMGTLLPPDKQLYGSFFI